MKPIKAIVKLQIPAGEASPAPPLGPALGQHGLNIADFCQKFNKITKDKKGDIFPVEVTIFEDRTFDFKLKTPPVTFLLKKVAKIEKGSGEPHKTQVGKVTKSQIEEIAKIKMKDFNTKDLEKAKKIVEGTARSMGIKIE